MTNSSFAKLVLIFAGENEDNSKIFINWEHYSFDSDFLTPCAGFSLVVGDEELSEEVKNKLKPGTLIQLGMQLDDLTDSSGTAINQNDYAVQQVNGSYVPISTGKIDQVEYEKSRNGTFIHIHGRDLLGDLVDSQIDHFNNVFKFNEGSTVGDIVGRVLAKFGIKAIYTTDAANREIISGRNPKNTIKILEEKEIDVPVDEAPPIQMTEASNVTIEPTPIFNLKFPGGNQLVSKDQSFNIPSVSLGTAEHATSRKNIITSIKQLYDPTAPLDLKDKDLKVSRHKPMHGETCYQFIERILKRFHLHCFPMIDGSGVVISTADYNHNPIFSIVNRKDGVGNNALSYHVKIDYMNQPSLIIAKGFSGGGDIEHTRIKAAVVNEFIGFSPIPVMKNGKVCFNPLPAVQEELNRFTTSVETPLPTLRAITLADVFDNTTMPSTGNIPNTVNSFGFGMGVGGSDLHPYPDQQNNPNILGIDIAGVVETPVNQTIEVRPEVKNRVKVTKVPITLADSHQYIIENYSPYFNPPAVPKTVYSEDISAKSVEQLIGDLMRELSHYQRNAMRLTYIVEDHQQNGNVWRFNTLCTVEDEVSGINGTFWIERVSFTKDRRGSGTTTKVELIPLYAITF